MWIQPRTNCQRITVHMFSFGNFAGCKIPFGVTLALECSSRTHLGKKKKKRFYFSTYFGEAKGRKRLFSIVLIRYTSWKLNTHGLVTKLQSEDECMHVAMCIFAPQDPQTLKHLMSDIHHTKRYIPTKCLEVVQTKSTDVQSSNHCMGSVSFSTRKKPNPLHSQVNHWW